MRQLKGHLISASMLVNLIEMLYTLVLDYKENGGAKATKENAIQIKQLATALNKNWYTILPSLKPAVQKALTGTGKIEHLVMLGQDIKENFASIRKDESFTSSELQVLNALGAFLRTDSESAWKVLQRMAGVAESPWVSQRMQPKVGTQKSSEGALRALVRKMAGRDDVYLSLDEAKVARDAFPDEYREYLELSRGFNQVWKDALVNYVRSSGKKYVPYEDVLAYMDANKIKHRLPIGFTGLVDDTAKLYTKSGKQIDGVPSAVTSPTITMNPNYGPESPWVFLANKAGGGPPTYFYTSDFKKVRAKDKFNTVKLLEAKMPRMRAKWFAMVKKFDPESAPSLAAVILELLWQFSARVGTKSNPTFGISTLMVKHAKLMPNGDILLSYKGKDQVQTKHLVKKADPEHRFLIPCLLALLQNKDPDDRIFSIVKGNRQQFVGPLAANKLFKTLGGSSDITVHKIRTFRGTQLFSQLVEKTMPTFKKKFDAIKDTKPRVAEAMAMEMFKKLATDVGKLLNHVRRGAAGTKVTPMTAIANYIDPAISVTFFRDLGLRPPKMLEKFDV